MQARQPLQARGQHALVRAVARVRPVQQRNVSGLADQHPKPHNAQVGAFALGVSAPSQIPLGGCRDVGVEVRGVEGEHIGRQPKPGYRRFRDCDLHLLQLPLRHLLRDAMECLPRERRPSQARHAGHTRIQESTEITLRSGAARPLDGHGDRQLPHRRPVPGTQTPAGSINEADQVQLFRHPHQRSDIPNGTCAHGTCGAQVSHRWGSSRSQDDLPRHRPPSRRVPYGLGRHPVAVAVHLAFEDVHVLSCIT